MPKLIVIMLLCFFAGGASAQPVEGDSPGVPAELSPEDLRIVAELETLQLWELAEEQEMMEDIYLLIEDEPNESQTQTK